MTKAEEVERAIGQRIRERRDAMNLSLAELARRGNFDEGWLARVESGAEELKTANLIALATALDVSIDWLLVGHPPELHRFLMTPAGARVQRLGLVSLLVQVARSSPWREVSVDLYAKMAKALEITMDDKGES